MTILVSYDGHTYRVISVDTATNTITVSPRSAQSTCALSGNDFNFITSKYRHPRPVIRRRPPEPPPDYLFPRVSRAQRRKATTRAHSSRPMDPLERWPR